MANIQPRHAGAVEGGTGSSREETGGMLASYVAQSVEQRLVIKGCVAR